MSTASVATLGIPGDRGWAVRDEKTTEIRGAKKFLKLMACRASYVDEHNGDNIPVANIVFPDGNSVRADSTDVNAALSEFLDAQQPV